MKTLKGYVVDDRLYVSDTGPEAGVGDQIKMFLDQEANPSFPEFIFGVIEHPIARVNCDSATSYSIEYDEDTLNGAAAFLRAADIVDATVSSDVSVVANALDGEIGRALAAEALLAPKASPTFTGTVTLPSSTSIGAVSSIEIDYINGVTSSVQTQINTKAPSASPTFTGTVVLPSTTSVGNVSAVELGYLDGVTSAIQTQFSSKANLASPTFTGVPAVPTAAYGTDTTQVASTAFVRALVTSGLASAPQSLSGPGAVNLTTFATELTSTGVADALTLADGLPGQLKSIFHGVDGGSMVLTPTTATGFTTVTFTNVGESVLLQFFATRGWMVLSIKGAIAA